MFVFGLICVYEFYGFGLMYGALFVVLALDGDIGHSKACGGHWPLIWVVLSVIIINE